MLFDWQVGAARLCQAQEGETRAAGRVEAAKRNNLRPATTCDLSCETD